MKKWMSFKPICWLIFATGFYSCATSQSLREEFQTLDGEQKEKFLSAYPDLTYTQRKTFVENPLKTTQLLQDWNVKLTPSPIGFMSIEPHPEGPVRQGTSLHLRAYLSYQNGRKIDVTQDVQWQALPNIFHLDHNVLEFGCVSSEVTVTANFLGEREKSITYSIQKPIQSLQVSLSEDSEGVSNSEYVRFKVLARCRDGTITDVSCQSTWNSEPIFGEFLNCGNLHLTPYSQKMKEVQVRVTYGNNQVQQKIRIPSRIVVPEKSKGA
jgi:hypothetical protein